MNDELKELFKSSNIKGEQKTQLTFASKAYISTIKKLYERKKLFKDNWSWIGLNCRWD